MENIKVSVILPVYNVEKYLEQCLNSILNQTLKEIEIICVDDGSTDSSLSILREFEKKDSRILVLQQTNKYAGVARNHGLSKASGEYLAFLDSDDFVESDFLEAMYNQGVKFSADVVMCDSKIYNNDTGEITKREIPEEKKFLPQNSSAFSRKDCKDVLFQLSNGWAWDKLFLHSFIKEHNLQFAGSRTANDGYFVYCAMAYAKCITKVSEPLVVQRVNNLNSLSNTRERSWECGFNMLREIKEALEKADIYCELERTFLNFVLKYLGWSYSSLKDWSVKEKVYEYVHEKCEPLFGIMNQEEEYYYYSQHYATYSDMIRLSFTENLGQQIDSLKDSVDNLSCNYQKLAAKEQKKVWRFPFEIVERGCNVVLYGAGKVGKDYYNQIKASDYVNLVLWMDKKFANEAFANNCGWLEELASCNYDKVVIAVLNEKSAEEISQILQSYDVPKEKIVWKV